MARLWLWVGIHMATACDFTLQAHPGYNNIWAEVKRLDPAQSPFVLCLSNSSSSAHFTLDGSCIWATLHLIIVYFLSRGLCEQEHCEKQVIWLQGSEACVVTDQLTFVNVTISGRHHFTEHCEEGEDWCTHCLNPELLVEEDGLYYTMIEHHPVLLDASYDEWQANCLWEADEDVFVVLEGGSLSIEDSVLADVRFKMRAFVSLENSSLRLVRSQVLRMDPSFAFIVSEDCPDTSIVIQDCYVAGLNRDHVYHPELGSDGVLIYLNLGSSVTFAGSVFTELMAQTPFIFENIIQGKLDSFDLSDTAFSRSVSSLLYLDSNLNSTLRNVTFEGNFAASTLIHISASGTLYMQGCSFTDNHSWNSVLKGQMNGIIASTFRNNRMVGDFSDVLFQLQPPNDQSFRLEHTVFEGNTALDSSFQAYWSDYYLDRGLLTDTGLSTEKAALQTASICLRVVVLDVYQELSIVNSTFTDSQSACDQLLYVHPYVPGFTSTHLLSQVRISTQATVAVWLHGLQAAVVLKVQNSLFERAGVQLFASGGTSGFTLKASNVTFQDATGKGAFSTPVKLDTVTSSFLGCSWRHNQGNEAGALSSLFGSVQIQASEFLNNSCWGGAGDVRFEGGENDSLNLSECMLTASKSLIGVASLLITGLIRPSAVSDCAFTQSHSDSGSFIKVAHSSGSFLLENIRFFDIDSPSAILILINVPSSDSQVIVENLQVSNSSFYQGIATTSGAPQVQTRHMHFTGNSGTLLWIKAGTLSDYGSIFAANAGPALSTFGPRTVSSLNCSSFRSNHLTSSHGVLFVEGPETDITLRNCEFSDNVVEAAGMLESLGGVSMAVFTCHLRGNKALSSLISLQSSTLLLQSSNISDTLDSLQMEDSTAQVISTTFSRISTRIGVFALIKSTLVLLNVSLSQMQGSGTCLLSAESSSVILSDVLIHTLICREEAIKLTDSVLDLQGANMSEVSCGTAVIASKQTLLLLQDVSVRQCPSQVLSGQSTNVTLSHCVFSRVHTQQKAVFFCSDCELLSIDHTTWEQLSAQSVGAILASATDVMIRHSTFTNISAEDTGAIRVSTSSFALSDSSFINNTAAGPSSSGGALWLSGEKLSITNSSFRENKAWTGGAVHWTSGSLSEQGNFFQDNFAGFYGPNWASFPSALHTSSSFLYLHLSEQLVVELLDHFGQVVLTDSSSQASLHTNSALTGYLQTKASRGRFIFSEFSTSAEPGSHIVVTIVSGTLALNVTFVQRTCERGEIYTSRSCNQCSTGTYSLELNATECKVCPKGSECRNGHKLFPKPGYWRPYINYQGMLLCPWAEACLGHNNYTSQTGACAQLYEGNLCQVCGEGTHRSGRDRCVSCPTQTALQVQVVFLGVGLPMLWSLQAFTSMRANSRLGRLLHLLSDYLQLTVLVADYDQDWPQLLQHFYSLHRYLGNAPQVLLPVECFYSDAFYVSTVAAALAPLIISAFFWCLWSVLWLILQATGYSTGVLLQRLFVNSVIVALAYIYPFLVRIAASAFVCKSIEPGEHWLRADLAVRCWDKSHLVLALTTSLPSLLVWGLGLPALASLHLIRQRKKIGVTDFLRGGLNCEHYLWTVGVGLCKAFVAVLYVFTAPLFSSVQALMLIAVLFIALVLQWKYRPYKETACNRVALLSLAVVWGTAYTGVSFSASGSNLLLIVLVLVLHGLFLLSWAEAVFGKGKALAHWFTCLKPRIHIAMNTQTS